MRCEGRRFSLLHKVKYLVVGAYAVTSYSVPRATGGVLYFK